MTETSVPTKISLCIMRCAVSLPSGNDPKQNAEVTNFKLALASAYERLDKSDMEVLAAAFQVVREIGDTLQDQITTNISEVTENKVTFR